MLPMSMFPSRPTGRFADLQIRSDVWPRVALAIYLLATTGFSVQMEIRRAMMQAAGINLESGALKNLLASYLPNLGLVVVKNQLPLIRRARLNLIRLTDDGKELARLLEASVVESDWEKLIRLHSGEGQLSHTTLVLYFAYQARLRGWTVTVLPEIGHPKAEPDVLVAKDREHVYVEVERGGDKDHKWMNQWGYQRFAALCALTAKSRAGRVSECKDLFVAGRATDIETLIASSRETPIGPLWVERW